MNDGMVFIRVPVFELVVWRNLTGFTEIIFLQLFVSILIASHCTSASAIFVFYVYIHGIYYTVDCIATSKLLNDYGC